MKPDRVKWWSAQYRRGDQFVIVEGVATNECPVSSSLRDGFAATVIELHNKTTVLKGVNVLGDGSELPAKLVDALEVVAVERLRADNALGSIQDISPGRGEDG